MKPISINRVNFLVFKSKTTAQITAIYGETRIKVKTKNGDYIGEISSGLVAGSSDIVCGFVLNTEFGEKEILLDDIKEIYYCTD